MKQKKYIPRIREIRKARHIARSEASRLSGVSPYLITRWELGLQIDRVMDAIALARVLGTTVEEMFAQTDRQCRACLVDLARYPDVRLKSPKKSG